MNHHLSDLQNFKMMTLKVLLLIPVVTIGCQQTFDDGHKNHPIKQVELPKKISQTKLDTFNLDSYINQLDSYFLDSLIEPKSIKIDSLHWKYFNNKKVKTIVSKDEALQEVAEHSGSSDSIVNLLTPNPKDKSDPPKGYLQGYILRKNSYYCLYIGKILYRPYIYKEKTDSLHIRLYLIVTFSSKGDFIDGLNIGKFGFGNVHFSIDRDFIIHRDMDIEITTSYQQEVEGQKKQVILLRETYVWNINRNGKFYEKKRRYKFEDYRRRYGF